MDKWWLFALTAALLGCSQLAPSSPSDEDVRSSFGAFASILDAQVQGCQPGTIGADQVQVCSVCIIAVSVQHNVSFSGGREHLIVDREYASAAFKRAISRDQPDVAPSAASGGVWVVLRQTVHTVNSDTPSASQVVPDEIANELGYQGATGFGAMISSSMETGVPTTVLERLSRNQQIRSQLVDIVGSCATPNRRSVPRLNTASAPAGEHGDAATPLATARGTERTLEQIEAELSRLPAPYNSANYEAGRHSFAQCSACHAMNENRVGPNLAGLFDRMAGTDPGFNYSDALKQADFRWDAGHLDHWISNPREFLPGNRMAFIGIRDEAQRRNLIAYLMIETKQ